MKHKFDEIFVVHLANCYDRYEVFTKEFERIGITPTIWWTTKHPWSTKISDIFKDSIKDNYYDKIFNDGNEEVYGNVYNCTLAHYDIIKTSYERGLNRILICEDDIKFCENLEIIEWYFNNFPDDFDVIKYVSSYNIYTNNIGFTTNVKYDNYNTLCYCLSRKGMKYYIDFIDNYFTAADIPFLFNGYYNSNKNKNICKKYNIELPKIYNTNYLICNNDSTKKSTII